MRPKREANPPSYLCQLYGLETPDQRDVERRGNPLWAETPKDARGSLLSEDGGAARAVLIFLRNTEVG